MREWATAATAAVLALAVVTLAYVIGCGLYSLRRWFRRTYRRAPGKPTPWTDESDPTIGWTYEIYIPGIAPNYSDARDRVHRARKAQLLYVGSSKRHPFGRLADHVTKDWFPDNALIRIEKHLHYAAAHDAEIEKIQLLLPSENKIRYTHKRVSRPYEELAPVSAYLIRIVREL